MKGSRKQLKPLLSYLIYLISLSFFVTQHQTTHFPTSVFHEETGKSRNNRNKNKNIETTTGPGSTLFKSFYTTSGPQSY